MFGIQEQAALMRLGLRYIKEFGVANNWVGRLPRGEEIDEWETNRLDEQVENCRLKRSQRSAYSAE